MSDRPFLLRRHAQKDLHAIRKYTINKWGMAQWLKYKKVIRKRMQALANNPNLGLIINEIADNAFRFPDNQHIFYYLKREKDVVFVGILSSNMAPEKHQERINRT